MTATSSYQPQPEILDKYAAVLVNFALGDGRGVQPGDVVRVSASECSKPLYFAVYRAIIEAGGNVLSNYQPDNDAQFNFAREYYELAGEEQLNFSPKPYFKALADVIDHNVVILGSVDLHSLDGVDSKKVMLKGAAGKPMSDLLNKKENAGEFTWTIALYGTEAAAVEAGMTLEEYWQQIIYACYLDEEDPVARWRQTFEEMNAYREKLNDMKIERVHMEGDDVDLWVKIGDNREWVCGRGRNIPSFEIFTSPEWRGTEGWIRFNQPLYHYDTMVTGIELHFEKGRVVRASANENEDTLKAMLETENADKLGEFSLTDSRHSRITRFMAETLYDENVGGRYGNTHVAVGDSFQMCYKGDAEANADEDWDKLGFNNSSVHTDIVSTTDRVVTAELSDGSTQVIYKDGQFQI